MVPKGWTKGTLKDDLDRVHQGLNTAAEKIEYVEKGFPILQTKHISSGVLETDDARLISFEDYDKYKGKYRPEIGSILFSNIGTIGRSLLITNPFDGLIAWNILYLKPSKEACPEFISYVLQKYKEQGFFDSLTAGNAAKFINKSTMEDLQVLYPPRAEQKKIAQILSTWDNAITTTEQLLANSLRQKKALMQQLLTGKKRLLDKNGVRFSGELKFQTISQISKRIQRKTDGEEHPILTISSLSGFVRQDERYSRYMAGESVKNYILLQKGEFAYNKGNSKTFEFGCIFDLDNFETGLVPHVYVCFKLNSGLSHRYFKYLFEADYLKPQLGALVNTGVRNNGLLNIKPTEFMATHVPVPSFDEQERIADVLQASSQTIHNLEQKLEALRQEKKALMQQLLTGKLRVTLNDEKSKATNYGN